MLDIKQIKSESVIDKILKQMIYLFKTEQIKVGEKLPPEREFSKMMGVSRNSLREAIKVLSVMNIVEMKHGSGTKVISHELDESDVIQTSDLLFSQQDYFQALEMRLILEPPIASLAAKRAETFDISNIERALLELKEKAEKRELFGMVGLKFHTSIVKAAKNNLAENALIPILAVTYNTDPEWRTYLLKKILVRPYLANAYQYCSQIFMAIKNGDAKTAETIMKQRLQENRKAFFGDKGNKKP